MAFSQSFDGKQAQIGNLTFHIFEHFLLQIIRLPQNGEKWFKNKPMEMKAWTSFLLRNSQKSLNWEERVPRLWLKDPWKDISFLIQKYITCEGRSSFIFLYHIRLLMHLNDEKPLNMPYYLLHSLTKMSIAIQKQTKNIERSLYHHGLIKMIVKHELMKKGMGWSKFLVANEFENIGDDPRNIVGNVPNYTAKVQEVHEIPRQGIENNT